MEFRLMRDDRFGLVKPAVDAHSLGMSSLQQLLTDCGYRCLIAPADACDAVGMTDDAEGFQVIERWLAENRITVLGFSYRLDPAHGAQLFSRLFNALRNRKLLAEQGGPLRGIFFAGLPQACEHVRRVNPGVTGVFAGSETPAETLRMLGVPLTSLPNDLAGSLSYEEDRLSFGRELVRKGNYRAVKPSNPRDYPEYGTREDSLVARLAQAERRRLGPLMRAHVGPYLPDRLDAVRLFMDWARQLAATGFLDVLSIGTSQLTQSDFGEDWGSMPNGGGVPLNSRGEFADVWRASRPMLVRTYAGTKNIVSLARMYEETINIAWHALSLWWFCRIDGRGPYSVRDNLTRHVAALKYIARTGKPFEANVPHHFAFRGADDVTYVVSAVIAAKLAKSLGIRHFILQNMLNTPRHTWGIQDLAKSRAMLQLARELQSDRFRVILQPRAGLDYFHRDEMEARAQLAAVSALMDDIEPRAPGSPPVIHVVSYTEASRLADPPAVDESIQITRHAIDQYRILRKRGHVDDMSESREARERTAELVSEARTVIAAVESSVPNPYSAEGLYQVFARGFLPVPYLWECQEEFRAATQWKTRLVGGSVRVVDESGTPLRAAERVMRIITSRSAPDAHGGQGLEQPGAVVQRPDEAKP